MIDTLKNYEKLIFCFVIFPRFDFELDPFNLTKTIMLKTVSKVKTRKNDLAEDTSHQIGGWETSVLGDDTIDRISDDQEASETSDLGDAATIDQSHY